MEHLLYELRPYYCIAIAVVGLTVTETIGKILSLVLGYCGVKIWMMRREYRGRGFSSLRA